MTIVMNAVVGAIIPIIIDIRGLLGIILPYALASLLAANRKHLRIKGKHIFFRNYERVNIIVLCGQVHFG